MSLGSLLKASGAQARKPSKYVPIWTDRFFTGYFSNRNPLRSPLSAYYAEGWNMGKADCMIDGLNIELSPRLTVIRRPGIQQFAPNTLPDTVQSFYNFHRSDGGKIVIADLPGSIYQVNPVGANFLIYSKPANSKARFQGVGGTLYFGDGQSFPRKWDSIVAPNTTYQMGIQAPTAPPEVQTVKGAGAATTLYGPQFTGSGGSKMVTTTSSSAPTTNTIEFWFSTIQSNQPIISFETSQTGSSATVLQVVWINSDKQLCYSIWDGQNSFPNTVVARGNKYNNPGWVCDGNWHHAVIQMQYNAGGYQPSANGATVGNNNNIVNVRSFDPSVNSPYTITNTNAATSGAAMPVLQVSIWIDGEQLVSANPQYGFYPSTPGWWRMGEATLMPPDRGTYTNAWYTGLLSEVAVYYHTMGAANGHFNSLVMGAVSDYEGAVTQASPTYWWKLNETSGTTAADSADSNPGQYSPGLALNQSLQLIYLPYAASTLFAATQIIIDPNGNYQRALNTGTSGATAPVWNTNIQGTTSDGTITWLNLGSSSINLSTAQGTFYVYAYGGYNGHVSTASPPSNPTGPITSSVNAVTVLGSSDPQVKNILIFRVADGGSTPFLVGSLPNPGTPVAVLYRDATPDAGLNILLPAPQAHANDPAPYGLTNFTYHLGRMWGSVNNQVYASAGPDVQIGNGNEAWPPANVWSFPAQVHKLVSTSAGLVVFTTSGIYMLGGGPAINQFYPQNLIERIGVSSYNAVDSQGSQIALFANDRNLLTIDPSTGFTNIGFPIADKLGLLDPSSVYVCYHSAGLDHAIFVGDGSTGWYRCAPQQPPDWQITGPVWSPFTAITGGCTAIASCEGTSNGYTLLIGQAGASKVYARDSSYSLFTDNGSTYSSYFTLGSIVLAAPGEVAEVAFITADFIRRGTSPTVSVLLDEINGTFSNISGFVVQDPPSRWGTTLAPVTLYSNRYYLRQSRSGSAPPPILCRHMQIKYDFGTDNVMNELISSTIFGAIKSE